MCATFGARREVPMQKPSFVLWTLLMTVLAGCFIMVLLLIPAVSDRLGTFILGAVVLSGLVSWPLSVRLARTFGLSQPS